MSSCAHWTRARNCWNRLTMPTTRSTVRPADCPPGTLLSWSRKAARRSSASPWFDLEFGVRPTRQNSFCSTQFQQQFPTHRDTNRPRSFVELCTVGSGPGCPVRSLQSIGSKGSIWEEEMEGLRTLARKERKSELGQTKTNGQIGQLKTDPFGPLRLG